MSVGVRLSLGTADARDQQMVTGVAMGTAHCRCHLCTVPDTLWPSTALVGIDQLRDLVGDAVHLLAERDDYGVFRPHALLDGSAVDSSSSLSSFVQSHLLLGFLHPPEPLHITENVSQSLFAHLKATLPSKVFKSAAALLLQEANVKSFTANQPSYRWRLVWASWPVTFAVAFGGQYTDQLQCIQSLTECIRILYSKPEARTARSLLRLFAHTAILQFLFNKLAIPIKLSEHFLFSHVPSFYFFIDFYNLSTERHEFFWKTLKRAFAKYARGDPKLMAQLWRDCVAERYARLPIERRRDHQKLTKFQQPLADIIIDQSLFPSSFLDKLSALLSSFGFGAEWQDMQTATNGQRRLVLRTDMSKPAPATPTLRPLDDLVQFVESAQRNILADLPAAINRVKALPGPTREPPTSTGDDPSAAEPISKVNYGLDEDDTPSATDALASSASSSSSSSSSFASSSSSSSSVSQRPTKGPPRRQAAKKKRDKMPDLSPPPPRDKSKRQRKPVSYAEDEEEWMMDDE
jgi:hypothetical protein